MAAAAAPGRNWEDDRRRAAFRRANEQANDHAFAYDTAVTRRNELDQDAQHIVRHFPAIGTRDMRTLVTDVLWVAATFAIILVDTVLLWQAFDYLTELLLAGAAEYARAGIRLTFSLAITIAEVTYASAHIKSRTEVEDGLIERPARRWVVLGAVLNAVVPMVVIATALATGDLQSGEPSAVGVVIFLTLLAVATHGLAIWGGGYILEAWSRRVAAILHWRLRRQLLAADDILDGTYGRFRHQNVRMNHLGEALGDQAPPLEFDPPTIDLMQHPPESRRANQAEANPEPDPANEHVSTHDTHPSDDNRGPAGQDDDRWTRDQDSEVRRGR